MMITAAAAIYLIAAATTPPIVTGHGYLKVSEAILRWHACVHMS